jgi:phosphatidylinositol-3-phosphatase
MKSKLLLCLVTSLFAGRLFAAEGAVPGGVPHLDHVFVIVMENHGYSQIVGNPNAPFANWYMHNANSANNYFAVGHPSLTNYLEIVGGSNFGIRSDNNPDWHNATCTPNLALGTVVTDNPPSPNACPISGSGTDGETPIIDHTNECSLAPCNPGLIDVNGTLGFRAAPNTSGKTIADQLAERGMTWKSYQESLPPTGADNVNFSDGFFTDSTNIPVVLPGETQTLIKLYAAKHNPFAYFRSVQEAEVPGASLKNVTGFMGAGGLYEDLEAGTVPAFSLIAPNQCNDQHGRGNAGPQCDFDPLDNGAQAGLNPALIYLGDLTLRNVVNAIHASPAWKGGKNAIVVVWDENDYSLAPNTNQVPAIVETNFSAKGVSSANFYTHFSLLRTLEGGLGLPCLNHACDSGTKTMSDLFGAK